MANEILIARLNAEAAPYRDALARMKEQGRADSAAGLQVRASVDYYAKKIALADRSPGWVIRARRAGLNPKEMGS